MKQSEHYDDTGVCWVKHTIRIINVLLVYKDTHAYLCIDTTTNA